MASATIYDAIKAKLVTDLGGSYAIRDWEQIERDLQQSDDPFLALEETDDDTETVSVGRPDANWLRDTGTIDVHILVPITGGLGPARTIGEAVRNSLQFQNFAPGFRCIEVSQPSVGAVNDGRWDSMICSVSFERTHAVATAS